MMERKQVFVNAVLLVFVMAVTASATTEITDTYVDTTGSINSSDWSNVTITESQISDLGSYFDSITDFTGTLSSGKICRWDGSEIDCDYTDQLGSGSGTNYWAVSGDWMYANETAGGKPNINVTAINASDWSNVTITESQISDLGSYLTEAINDSYYLSTNPYGFYNDTVFDIADYSTTSQMNTAIGASNTSMKAYVDGQGFLTSYTETDPYWTANQSDYSTTSDMNTAIGSANTSMKAYVDAQDTAFNASIQTYCVGIDTDTNTSVVDWVSGQGYLTSYSETDPYWTANQSDYYTSSEVDTLDTGTNTSLKNWVEGQGYITGYTETDPYWTANQSDYYTSSQTDSAISTANSSMKDYIDGQGFLTSYTETDPFWSGNITTCNSDQKLYILDGSLACNDDQLGAGGSGAPHWVDNGTFLSPNGSYAVNVDVQGWIQAGNWTNVSITESQVSDLGSYLETELDPYWTANQSDYSTTSDMNTAIGSANTTMKAYVDSQDTIFNTSATDYFIAYLGEQGYLTSFTELDPYWTANQSDYSTTSDMNTAIGNANSSMKDYVDAEIAGIEGGVELDPYWTANQSDYSTTSDMNSAIGAANTSMKTYVDAQDTATNTSATGYCVAYVGDQGYLTSYTETDPYWTANQSDYSTTSDMNTAIGSANTSMKDYVDATFLTSSVADADVDDDITITSSNMINTTSIMYSTKICLDSACNIFVNGSGMYQTNGGSTWWFHVNASGDLRIESV